MAGLVVRFLLSLVAVFGMVVVSQEIGDAVTCGSVVKLIHKDTGHHLHSHQIAWGSGSGQQSVTTTGSANDPNSLWLIKESVMYLKGKNAAGCELGMPVKCGDKIRLEHIGTGKNLHSHLYKAPISGNQEVSGYGEKGKGDTGDNWTLQCEGSETFWHRGSTINLVHVDTSRFLTSEVKAKFTTSNCGQGEYIVI